ncbi:MAG: hypothetical protein NZM00_01825, partial [Anaerolinea sp.]|nr:hypothetical protein [Anaerolinea sp.]
DLDSQTPVFSVELALPPGESFPSLYGIDYSPDGRLLAASNAGQIALIDAETGTVLDELHIPPDPEYGSSSGIWSLRFRADSRALYAVDWSGRLLIHQFEAGLDRPQTETYQLLSDYAAFYHVDVLPDGSALLGTFDTLAIYQPGASTLDVLLEVYPPEFGLTIPTLSDNLSAIAGSLDDPALAVYGFALTPDASLIALGRTSAWTLYDRERGREVITHALEFGSVPSTEQVYALAFSPDGLRLALMGTDGGLRIVSVETGEVLTQPYQFNSGIDPRWG